jgi:hypothetical protein
MKKPGLLDLEIGNHRSTGWTQIKKDQKAASAMFDGLKAKSSKSYPFFHLRF